MIIEKIKDAINWNKKMGLAIVLGITIGLILSMYSRIAYFSDKEYKAITSKLDKNKDQVSKLSKDIEDNNNVIEKYKLSPEFKKGN